MSRRRSYVGYASMAPNATPLYLKRKLFSGQNTRFDASQIGEDEFQVAYNVDLGTPGKLDKRPGLTLIANDVGTRTMTLSPYYPTGGTDAIYRVEGVNVRKWTGSGNWSAALYSSLTTGLDTNIVQGGESGNNEVLLFQNGLDNPLRMTSGDAFADLGSGSTSPPKSAITIFFNNRWWILKNGFLYYSSAFPSDYSTAFSGSNGYRFSGFGGDMGLYSVRDVSTTFAGVIVVFMQKGIFGISPSATPAATDIAFPFSLDHSAINRKCITQGGDDVYYLAPDGIRSLKRTVQDKLQFGTSYPLSYRLKDEFDNINWAQSSKFHMIFWQDKLFFFFVQAGGTDINRAWVYWPALDDKTGKGWAIITGWTVTSAAKFFVSGQEKLYGGSTDGKCYQLWAGYDDNSTAINMQVETREEDFGYPANYKSGGELEVVAQTVGNYDITISASIDGGAYTTLGTLNLTSTAPALPVNLPFYLQPANRVSGKFHLDSLGRFKRINFKFQHNATNGSDQIRILEYNVASFLEAYEEE